MGVPQKKKIFLREPGGGPPNQGGELARSSEFKTMLEAEFGYIVEPTGADSPSQNGGSEIYNDKLHGERELPFSYFFGRDSTCSLLKSRVFSLCFENHR